MHYHGAGLIGFYDVTDYGPDSPSEFQKSIREGTRVAVPLGVVELEERSVFYYRLQYIVIKINNNY